MAYWRKLLVSSHSQNHALNNLSCYLRRNRAANYLLLKMSSTSDNGNGGNLLSKEEVAAMRINYDSKGLKVDELEKMEPFTMFDAWFKTAKECKDIIEANSMSLASVSSAGKPSVRIVLLKGYDQNGFRFFTNFESRKGREMGQNPNVAIMFYWEPLQRQIRIEGKVNQLSCEDSTRYFHSRPRASQIGAIVSRQSQVIPNKEFLDKRYSDIEKEYEGKEIPKPDYWGGYNLKPERFEFWSGGKGRMHDRIQFRKPDQNEEIPDGGSTKHGEEGWLYELLSP